MLTKTLFKEGQTKCYVALWVTRLTPECFAKMKVLHKVDFIIMQVIRNENTANEVQQTGDTYLKYSLLTVKDY
jgi:hypothetical protein